MKKRNKVLLGIATLWPVLYMFLFFLLMFSMFLTRGGAPWLFFLIIPFHFLTIFGHMALTIFYVIDAYKSERIDKDKKVIWVILLVMGGMIAAPIYWYLFIWRDAPEAPFSTSNQQRALHGANSYGWDTNSASRPRDSEYVPPPQPPDWR